MTLAGPTEARPSGGLTTDSLSCPIAPNVVSSSGVVRDGRLRTNIGPWQFSTMCRRFNPTKRIEGKGHNVRSSLRTLVA